MSEPGIEASPYRVAVRSLCDFTARTGDLDLRFTPSPTAQEGVEGHQRVAAGRGETFEAEVTLSARSGRVEVSGRCDGIDMQGPHGPEVQEIKTHRGALDAMPANQRALHWAQACVYAALICRARALHGMQVVLIYFDIATEQETRLEQWWSADALDDFFIDQVTRFQAFADQELAHRAVRDQALTTLAFPFADFRPGQRPLAENVYKAAHLGRHALLEAPTGLGKTLGTLFPMLKAMPDRLDRVFFLTARTTGRQLALDGLAALGAADRVPVRVLELRARDKACEHPDLACHGDSCPLAQGFYDRLPAARQACATQTGLLDGPALRTQALTHGICPYYLGQEMARWSDVIIGDVNHYFDLSAMLHALTRQQRWQVGVLVDEAHNLVDRVRGMYSAHLDQHRFRAVRRQTTPPLRQDMDRLQRQWLALNRTVLGDERTEAAPAEYGELKALPTGMIRALKGISATLTEMMATSPLPLDSDLLNLYFDVLHLIRLAERVDEDHFMADLEVITPARGRYRDTRLSLRCVLPAALLAPRWQAARSVVLFSATLSPAVYYRRLLGLETATYHSVASPFTAGQLQVHVERHVSTRYRDRAASLAPMARVMADRFMQQPGNYLAFFSSYAYLRDARAAFMQAFPSIPVWAQDARMDESARSAFLARFEEGGQGIGFVVLGGIFGEAIDLPGTRLIGAFIATLGLAQVNPVNEAMRRRLDQYLGHGYDYVYLYPGLTRVVQAAGRVIRTPEDTGVIHLMDDRFDRAEVQALLPTWWELGRHDPE
ncbi:ATP-dependent DNA helicase [Larsenimonas rhizosphaerae]|uniref:ATP-dependent DNA helicase n=1 Tax=Larsenimonas rhizosphaerae TaxID=2944682 RepID=A0AA41ZLN8_9GAMM|nr:ATP-dependent DNA helicase [Larsenimonas rhizosphaerae]MCX2524411.1 ATP-dependent DNA helicase [Larsenimonas rhizosphaerae]